MLPKFFAALGSKKQRPLVPRPPTCRFVTNDSQWLPPPVTFATPPSPQDLMCCVSEAELHRHLCVSLIKVEEPLHGGNPTLSAEETMTQWHGEPLHLETSPAAVDGRDVFRALSRPKHSTMPCCSAFPAVEPRYWVSSARSAVAVFAVVRVSRSPDGLPAKAIELHLPGF